MSTKKEQDNETVTFRVPYKVLGIGALMFLSGTGAGGGLSSLVTFSPDKVKKTHQEQEDALGALINAAHEKIHTRLDKLQKRVGRSEILLEYIYESTVQKKGAQLKPFTGSKYAKTH